MKNIFTFFLISYSNILFAQPTFVKVWDGRYGGSKIDWIRSIVQTSDKGFLFGGFSFSPKDGDVSEGNHDITFQTADYWLIKTDSMGIKQWDKRYGGNGTEGLTSICPTFDGGFLLGGYSSSGKSGDKTQSSQGGFDYWIIKIDSAGNKKWDRSYGGSDNDEMWEVKQTLDGGFILGGYSYSDSSGDKTQNSWGHQDYWIVKTDSLGNKQWDKRFGDGASNLLYSLLQTDDGGYLLGGFASSGVAQDKTDVGYGNGDYWIIKTDSIGNKQWDKCYGGWAHDDLNVITKVQEGGYILAGTSENGIGGNKTDSSRGLKDYWLVRIDRAGNILWDKDYGGRGEEYKVGNVVQTSDKGFLIGGITYADSGGDKTENNLGLCQPWIVKTDYYGNLQWEKTILVSGNNCLTSGGFVIQSDDVCFVSANNVDGGIGGYKTQLNWDTSESTSDIWIVKFCDTSLFTPVNKMPDIQNQLSVYPIPFFSDINIQLEKVKIKLVKIMIKNILGETVYFNLSNNTDKTFFKNIDLSFLSNGFYLLEMDFDGERIARKLIKESLLIN